MLWMFLWFLWGDDDWSWIADPQHQLKIISTDYKSALSKIRAIENVHILELFLISSMNSNICTVSKIYVKT